MPPKNIAIEIRSFSILDYLVEYHFNLQFDIFNPQKSHRPHNGRDSSEIR